MDLASPTALKNLCTLILCNHPLNLYQQFIFCALASGAEQKNHPNTMLGEFVEQHHLVRVSSGQAVWAVNVEDFQITFSRAITESFERWAHQGRSAVAFVDVDVSWQYNQSIGLGSFPQRSNLAFHRRLPCLLLRGDPRIECHVGHLCVAWVCLRECPLWA